MLRNWGDGRALGGGLTPVLAVVSVFNAPRFNNRGAAKRFWNKTFRRIAFFAKIRSVRGTANRSFCRVRGAASRLFCRGRGGRRGDFARFRG